MPQGGIWPKLVNGSGLALGVVKRKFRLSPQRIPLRIDLNVTKACNLRCCHCYALLETVKEAKDPTLSQIKNIIDDVHRGAALLPSCPYEAVYGASKSFLANFSLALSQEYKRKNVHVACLMPGNTDTDFWSRARVSGKKVPESNAMALAKDVARLGFQMLLERRACSIFGGRSRFKLFASRFIPKSWLNEMICRDHAGKYLCRPAE